MDSERAVFYLHRAKEIRAIAASMKDQECKRTLMQVAKDYEAMAQTTNRVYPQD